MPGPHGRCRHARRRRAQTDRVDLPRRRGCAAGPDETGTGRVARVRVDTVVSEPGTGGDRAARAWQYANWRERPEVEPVRADGIDHEGARTLVREALTDLPEADGGEPPSVRLDPVAAQQLLEKYGIHVVPFREVSTMHEASAAARELGFPVAVKATSSSWRVGWTGRARVWTCPTPPQ